MNRRRALMAQSKGPKLLYELKNETVTTGMRFLTEVCPYVTGKGLTLLFDFKNTANPSTSNTAASLWYPFYIYNNDTSNYSFLVGKTKVSGTYQKFVAQGDFASSWGQTMASASSPSAKRHRYVVTHDINSPTVRLQYRGGTGSVLTYTITRPSFVPAPTGKVSFGGVEDGTHSLPAGTINLAQIWDGVLSDDEINDFLGV